MGAAVVGKTKNGRIEVADLGAVEGVHIVTGGAATTALQLDELVTGDLRLEAGATLAQDAAIAI